MPRRMPTVAIHMPCSPERLISPRAITPVTIAISASVPPPMPGSTRCPKTETAPVIRLTTAMLLVWLRDGVAARGLLYAWDPGASAAVLVALRDRAWRVREMAAKAVRLRGIADAESTLTALLDDPVERV